MSWPLIALVVLIVGGGWVVLWSVLAMSARQDAEEAQRELLGLLVEQADDRAIADNLDV